MTLTVDRDPLPSDHALLTMLGDFLCSPENVDVLPERLFDWLERWMNDHYDQGQNSK